MKQHTCPTCKGKGKQTANFCEGSFNDEGKYVVTSETPFSHTCYDCKGTGQVDTRTLNAIKKEKEMWCKCESKGGSQYVPDNTRGAAVRKHHYTCRDCGKVTQIG